VVTFILELMPGFVNVIAVGHLGEAELASVSLAAMVSALFPFFFFSIDHHRKKNLMNFTRNMQLQFSSSF